jgi:hypothetical protein
MSILIKITHALFLLLCLKSSVLSAQKSADIESCVHALYAEALVEVRIATGCTPPVTARIFGYAGLCLYEATTPFRPGRSSLLNEVQGYVKSAKKQIQPQDYDESLIVCTALASIFDSLLTLAPNQKSQLSSIKAQYQERFQSGLSKEKIERSIAFGTALALEVFQLSKTDGATAQVHRNYDSSHQLKKGKGKWRLQPLQTALLPAWGNNRSMVAANATVSLKMPIDFSTDSLSPFYLQAKEVADAVSNTTQVQRETAFYWSDTQGSLTPAGHMVHIAQGIMITEGLNLADISEIYAALGIALSDAMVACWKIKYDHSLIRPKDYIQDYIAADWNTVFLTPPFPEFPSGHCTQAGVAEAILEYYFGVDYSFIDQANAPHFANRSFVCFDQMVEEIGLARLVGGLHYRFSNQAGRSLGNEIGLNTLRLFHSDTNKKRKPEPLPIAYRTEKERQIKLMHLDQVKKVYVTTLGGNRVSEHDMSSEYVQIAPNLQICNIEFIGKDDQMIVSRQISFEVNQRVQPYIHSNLSSNKPKKNG